MTVLAHERLAARPDARVEHLLRDAFALELTYALELPDGQVRRFRLRVESRGVDRVTVRESGEEPRQLPLACPERHINDDGGFCFGLPEDEPDLTTIAGVDRWWGRLAGYLRLQVVAAATGRWQEGRGWRHGRAGETQRELEQLTREAAWLETCPIAVLPNGRIADRRAPCPCGSGAEARACHEPMMVQAGRLRRLMDEQEAEYYRKWSAPCCETMESCGVRCGAKRRKD